MKVTFHTGFKVIMASIAVIAGMTAVWVPLIGGWAVYAAVITTAFVAILGIPVFLLLRAKGWLNGKSLMLAGFIGGGMPFVFLSMSADRPLVLLLRVATALGLYGGLGLVSAVVFGAVWNLLSQKPDRFPWFTRAKQPQEAAT